MTTAPGAGDRRGGSYAVHAEIGAGGMATVHLGRLVGARGFARTVAIKVLHETFAKNKEFVGRFVDEARLVSRIHHPNVMPTLDVIAEGDDLRIVMDYVAGETLDQLEAHVQRAGERVPVRIACSVVGAVLHGLHAAHEAKNEFGEPLGIVHLDVSPQNILVGTDGTTRVLDFGVARARGERADPGMTGKSAYLAPEQVRGALPTPRTDVFAASIVLWELLTGEPLFAADNHAATMQRVLACIVPAPSASVADLPARLDDVLKVGLAREPGQRFATARDMALALEQAVVPATASEVGAWVERVAAVTLALRAEKVQAMEASSVLRADAVANPPMGEGKMPGLVSPRDLYEEEAAVNRPSVAIMDAKHSVMHGDGADPSRVPRREADGSIVWNRASRSPGARVAEAPRPGSAPPPPAPVDLLPAPHLLPPRAGRSRRGLAIGLGAAVVVGGIGLLVARAVLLPAYVSGMVQDLAAAHGVTLTVADASLSDDGVLLSDLTVRIPAVPQLTVTLASADVRVSFRQPNHLRLGKTEITLDGDALPALEAWAAATRAKGGADNVVGSQIEMPAGHLVWTHPSGDVTRLEATGLQGTLGSITSVSLLDEGHVLSNALTVETRVGTFGPWSVDVDRTPKELRARLAFDPAVPDGANALFVEDATGGASFDVTLPRLPTASLGLPRTLLGAGTPLPQQAEVALHYARSLRGQASGSLRAAFYGVHVPELGTSVEARVSGEASGPATGSMTIKNGVFSVGPVRGTLTGAIIPAARSASASVAWKAEPLPCSSLVALPSPGAAAADLTRQLAGNDPASLGDLARDVGALGQALGALKVTGSFAAQGTVVADSGDLAHAKLGTVTKNACGIALFQGK